MTAVAPRSTDLQVRGASSNGDHQDATDHLAPAGAARRTPIGSALVLNASYEPLAIVSGRRAVVLLLDGKADAIDGSGREMHGARLTIEIPSVVRLRYHVKVPYQRDVALSRRGVFARDAHACQYCGGRAETLDHVVPRSRGGGHTWDNVVAACRPCNVRKADRLLDEVRMALRRHPAPPRRLSWVLVAVGRVPEAWQPWVRVDAA